MTDPATLRELFEACKSGDLSKVKKLLTPQNVNEIGKIFNYKHFVICKVH